MATAGVKPKQKKRRGDAAPELNRAQRRAMRRRPVGKVEPDCPRILARCGCSECEGKRQWPRYYTGLVSASERVTDRRVRRVSWECHLEGFSPKTEPPHDEPRRLTKRDAFAEDLTILRRGRVSQTVSMTRHCETCDGLRKSGRRYCLRCEAEARQQMKAAGWTPEMIDAWCARKSPDKLNDVRIAAPSVGK